MGYNNSTLDVLLNAIEQGKLQGRIVDPEGARIGDMVIKLVMVDTHRFKIAMEKQ